MPTISNLLKLSFLSARQRAQLLILLSVLAGLASSLLLIPAMEAMEAIKIALVDAGEGRLNENDLVELVLANADKLVWGYITLLAIMALLLPFWARASSPLDLIPWDGNISAHGVRALASFFHLLLAAGLTLMVLMLVLVIMGALGAVLGDAGGLLVTVAFALVLWVSLFFSAAANSAIITSSTDKRRPFVAILARLRLFLRPAVGSLAVFVFFSLIVENTFGSIAATLDQEAGTVTLASFVHGAVAFLSTALHISVLQHIPGLTSQESGG